MLKTVFFLMFATGITDGELEMSEIYDDETFYEQSDCKAVAAYLQRLEDSVDRPGYFYCLKMNN